ncbi:MAG: SIS domain-containing protein [Desulfomonile tiedjei]|uniref:SIS domain-containing protein n=1 Tax=Desulfomonile tiedjei TaxID=2358 RepID=A0A9D6UZP9_9BACT|nr:SIS domain-containing protein [Desulfomonile tiedjei]
MSEITRKTKREAHVESGSLHARKYIDRVTAVLRSLDFEAVGRVIELFAQAREGGNTIFFLGNGGSAATASHFANDLGFGASPEGKTPFRAMCLASNTAFLTCLANDIGYENVFSRQLRNLMRPGDIVVGISASGNSPNVVNALAYAVENGGIAVAFTGFDGGRIKNIAHYCVHFETAKGEYGPVEDAHMVLDHLISGYLALVD